jgi:hypothetical protein
VIFSRQFGYEFAILMILAIIGIFLFPVAGGSYSAMHGPVTALRSATAKLKMWLLLTLAGLYVWGCLRSSNLIGLCAHYGHARLPRPSVPEDCLVFRC